MSQEKANYNVPVAANPRPPDSVVLQTMADEVAQRSDKLVEYAYERLASILRQPGAHPVVFLDSATERGHRLPSRGSVDTSRERG